MDFYGMHGGGDSRGSYGEIGGPGGPGSYPITDKRNRNPNWTDGEIIRFLEILQEEDVLKDLMANRNKQVFCYVAQRLCAEGAPKTWDQCRIKLKNLKSQYRYIKERIPQIVQLDLEDDTVMKRLIHECQGRGISPSNLKHLRYLKRFLAMMSGAKSPNPLATSSEFLPQLPPLTRGIRIDSGSSSLGGVGVINENSNSQEARLSDPLDGITRIRGSKRSRGKNETGSRLETISSS